MPRKSANQQRFDRLEKDVEDVRSIARKAKNEAKRGHNRIDNLVVHGIKDMLRACDGTNSSGDKIFTYTYEQIAKEMGVSVNTVRQIADEFGLSHAKNKGLIVV
mgnify:FL=1